MDLNLILGIVVIAIIALFVIIGLLKGGLRTLIGMFWSSVLCLVVAAAVAFFVVPGILENILDEPIAAYISGLIGDVEAVDFLFNELFVFSDVSYAIIDVAVIAVAAFVLYYVFSMLFWLLKRANLRIVRTYKSRTVDLIIGAVIWGAIGAVIAVGIIFGLSMLEGLETGIDFIDDLVAEHINPLFAEDGEGLFNSIQSFVLGLFN